MANKINCMGVTFCFTEQASISFSLQYLPSEIEKNPRSSWIKMETYIYSTVHHLDSWVKRDQLDVTCFIISLFNAQHVSDVNTSILRSLRLICWFISWVILLWFDVCWCYFVVWLRWCGIRMQAEAAGVVSELQAYSMQPGYSSLTAPNLQPTANQERNDQRGNQHYIRELLMMGIVVPETCWAYKKYNKISGILLDFILQIS